jgi:sortase A
MLKRGGGGLAKFISFLFIIVGVGFLVYGGGQLFKSHLDEGKRLDEAKGFVSEEIVHEAGEAASYENIIKGDTIGLLYIPRLDREIPIVEGTDEEELSQGVGHYTGTGLPGENKQILLSGHRDTVFRSFGELEHGDEFHVKMKHGTFVYEISDHEIVDADNTTVIDPSREDEYLTVSTCYPFSYIGNAPDRFVFYAYPK